MGSIARPVTFSIDRDLTHQFNQAMRCAGYIVGSQETNYVEPKAYPNYSLDIPKFIPTHMSLKTRSGMSGA